ncbi:MAG: 50S ribosomal protein L19 [Candidatus Babeliaceae bacterium]|jgi:large subunit ribosomal protein L19
MKAQKYTKETIRTVGMEDRGFPQINVGDAVEVIQKIKEGDKERLQTFEGDIIAIRNKGVSTTFTVRRIGANGVSVERIFPYYSPIIEKINHLRTGDVCRAKLFYMRYRIGKSARVKEKVLSREQKGLASKAG